MKKRFAAVLIILLFVLPVCSWAETSGWFGGFGISSEGFISDGVFNEAEYTGINLYAEPWTFPLLTPSFSAGVLLPLVPFEPSAGLVTAELGFELFSLNRHPFSWAIDLENAWCPLLSLRLLHPFETPSVESLYLSAVLSPFRLKTGSGRFSLLSLAYVTDTRFSYAGWGIRVFDFRLYLL